MLDRRFVYIKQLDYIKLIVAPGLVGISLPFVEVFALLLLPAPLRLVTSFTTVFIKEGDKFW